MHLRILPALLLMAAGCTPGVMIPVVESFPDRLLRVIGGHRRLTVQFKEPSHYNGRSFYESLATETRSLRYYLSIDRREQAGTPSAPGLPSGSIPRDQVGQVRGAELILLVDFPRNPDYNCQTSMYTVSEEICVKWEKKPGSSKDECVKKQTIITYVYTATDTFTLWVVANLMSVETSRTMAFANTKPFVYFRQSRGTPIQCLGYAETAVLAERSVALVLAAKISPVIRDLKVPLYSETDELAAEVRPSVADLLKKGIAGFAANPDQSNLYWEEALRLSGGRSLSASWNLAVYCWAARKMDEAQRHFDAALSSPGWRNRSRREIFNRFYREKKLVEKYRIEGL